MGETSWIAGCSTWQTRPRCSTWQTRPAASCLACFSASYRTHRCWWELHRCWWELSSRDWQIWLEPASESSGSSDTLSSFRVVLMAFHRCAIDSDESASPALYTYSTTSNDWRSVHHRIRPHPRWSSCVVTKGGYVNCFGDIGDSNCKRVWMSWDSDCITQLPDPPLGVELISDPSTAAVFGWKVDKSTCKLSLYRLDEISGWRCLYSGLPPHRHPREINVQATKILGNMLILVLVIWEYPEEQDAHCSLAMAYHMHDGSCQWFRLPAQYRLLDYTPISSLHGRL